MSGNRGSPRRRGPMLVVSSAGGSCPAPGARVVQGLVRGAGVRGAGAGHRAAVQEATRRLLVLALEAKDRWLMEGWDRRPKVVNLRPKGLLTKVGEITFTRRYYMDRATGEGRSCWMRQWGFGLTCGSWRWSSTSCSCEAGGVRAVGSGGLGRRTRWPRRASRPTPGAGRCSSGGGFT